MGASNFARCSTSKYFTVLMNVDEKYSECSECEAKHWEYDDEYVEETIKNCSECGGENCITHGEESRSPEEWECEDLISEVKSSLSQLPEYQEGGQDDNDRNYYGKALGRLIVSKYFGDVEVSIEIIAMLRSAYYEGATLDFDEEIQVNGYEHDEDIDLSYAYQTDMNNGMLKIQSKNAKKWVEKTKPTLIAKLEEVYEKFSTPMDRLGGFSDGTSIYTLSK